MAAPATPPTVLPRSNFHQSNAAASAVPSAHVPVWPPTAASADQDAEGDFTHPDYPIVPRSYTGVDNLVIVCCHAIFHPDAASPSFPLHSPYDESNWHLAPFQRSDHKTGKPGEHETFVAHALAGIDVLTSPANAGNTLLVLSGGSTKPSLTSLSEARSYYHAALAHELAQGHRGGGRAHAFFSKGRILLEEHAADSFQNLLYSILLFRRTTGVYPKHIRVITHAFKAKRFLDLHANAIHWPSNKIQVQGIDPVMSSAEREDTVKGEEKYGYASWLEDPLGTGDALSGKRRQRGWDEQGAKGLAEGLEESVEQLLNGSVSDDLPWSTAPKARVAAASG